MYAIPVAGHMGKYKILNRIFLRFFDLECVLLLKNESRNVLTVYLYIDGDDVVKS